MAARRRVTGIAYGLGRPADVGREQGVHDRVVAHGKRAHQAPLVGGVGELAAPELEALIAEVAAHHVGQRWRAGDPHVLRLRPRIGLAAAPIAVADGAGRRLHVLAFARRIVQAGKFGVNTDQLLLFFLDRGAADAVDLLDIEVRAGPGVGALHVGV